PQPPSEGVGDGSLLFLGRVVPQKGLDTLVRCLRHVRSAARLVVAGDGPDLGRVRQLTQTLGLAHRVSFVGWVSPEHKAVLCERASVVVIPSVWPEPFGLVGLEAMSHGRPVVAFDVGGISDWLQDGVTGYLVRPYDVEEMARRIDHLLDHAEVAHDFG